MNKGTNAGLRSAIYIRFGNSDQIHGKEGITKESIRRNRETLKLLSTNHTDRSEEK